MQNIKNPSLQKITGEVLIIVTILILSVAFIIPTTVNAVTPGTCTPETEQDCAKEGIRGVIGIFDIVANKAGFETDIPPLPLEVIIGLYIRGSMVFIGVVFAILIIYGGYLWMVARGNEEYVKKAVGILKSSIIGFILVMAAYSISNYIVQKVLMSAFFGQ